PQRKKKPKSHKTLIPKILKKARITVDFKIEGIMWKDSKFINDKDRELILKKCKDCPEDKIVIVHGTMTMAETANYINKKKLKKTIVLVGSAIPANKQNSDALFNIGAAITAVQILPFGVYVTMNGKIFPGSDVRKNFETGYFENSK
ncbi:MAG: asparaginase, partial [Candidatus Diapherotrites archaeon CG_4_10_14_0_2_um_filter_31_5]